MESVPRKIRKLGKKCLIPAMLACFLLPVAASASTPRDRVKVIYVIPGSHWDLGFLRPPHQEMDAIKPNLDAVIQACHADPQFRWTIESVWQLNAWLQRTNDPAEVEQMAALLRSGQIELSAADGSMHTEFMGSEELNRLVDAARTAGRRFGIDPQVAMMNDVPGFSIRLPQVLARSGVRFLITGSNTAFGGGTKLWPGTMPFYWEGPDGSKVLMWQTQGKNGGYTEGMADYFLDPSAEDPYFHTKFYPKAWAGLPDLEIMQRGIHKLLTTYEGAGYRHSALAVFFMHDGIGPDYELHGLLPAVRAWNAAGRLPKLVVATPSEFFANLMQQEGESFPVYRGDWSGLWAHVKVNSPGMSADALSLQDRLPEAETLWSLLKMQGVDASYPGAALASSYSGLFQYDEHNGAGQAGWPKVMTRQEVLEQNQQYSDALRAGVDSTDGLLTQGIQKLASTADTDSHRTVVVYNPSSWTASQIVKLREVDGSYRVRDAASGEIVPSQKLSSGELYFEARDVPSIGYRTYFLEPDGLSGDASVGGEPVLRSPFFEVRLDSQDGSVVRITDLRTHTVVVDRTAGGQAGVLQVVPSRSEDSPKTPLPEIHHERGALLDSVVIRRPETPWTQTTIALPQTEPVVQLTEVLDRSKMPFVPFKAHGISYSFGFRFSLPGTVQRWINNGNGLYRFPQDLLPGAKTDAVVPRHVLAWSANAGGHVYHVMLQQQQAFFDDFDEPGGSASPIPDGTNVEAMIKSDQGETKDQGIQSFSTFEPGYGPASHFSFTLSGAEGDVDPVAMHRFAARNRFEVVLLPTGVRPRNLRGSFLSLSASNVVVEDLMPALDGNPGHYILRLQEIAGTPTHVKLTLAAPVQSMDETTLSQDRVLRTGLSAGDISLAAYETLTLRLSIAANARETTVDATEK